MTAVIAILLAPFAILTAFFAAEVVAGVRRTRRRAWPISSATAVIVVPAHDEAAVIRETLRSLKSALSGGMRVLVVADNCEDETAALARESGVEVLERHDLQLRGKGHALAFAADYLRPNPPDVLVVLDADCETDAASLRALVDCAAATGRPCQAVYLIRPDCNATPVVQLSTFAFMLKNLVRQRGLQTLAGRAHLTGTGMAMPFQLFQPSPEVRASVVEDLALGLELAQAGHSPQLVNDAFVWSSASTEQGTLTQRRRWEGGFLGTALPHSLREARLALHGRPRLLLVALDLMVPPLALFAMLNVAFLMGTALLTWISGAAWWPVLTQVSLLALAVGAVLVAWITEGRGYISLGVLARLPLYVLWKLPMYLGFARHGAPKEWLRPGR